MSSLVKIHHFRQPDGTHVQGFEYLSESLPDESCEEQFRRYMSVKYPPPPPKVVPQVPIIEPLFEENEPRPVFDSELAAKADSSLPSWDSLYQPAWPTLSSIEALDGVRQPEDMLLLTTGGLDAVEQFGKMSALRHSGFSRLCCNPIMSYQCRATKSRQSIIVVLPGPNIDLPTQMQRALFLNEILPLELSVWVPHKMSVEHWYSADAPISTLKTFARTALRLGAAANTFAPNFIARMPSAIDPIPGPVAAKEMLANCGLSYTSNACLVLYKRPKLQSVVIGKAAKPSRIAPVELSEGQDSRPLVKTKSGSSGTSSKRRRFPDSAWKPSEIER